MSPERGLAEWLGTGAGLACVVAALLLSSAGIRVTPHVAAGTVESGALHVAGSPSASLPPLVPARSSASLTRHVPGSSSASLPPLVLDGPAAPGSRLVLRRKPAPPPCD